MSCLDLWVAAFDRLSDAIENWDPCCDEVSQAPDGADEILDQTGEGESPTYDRDADEHPTEYADPEEYDAYLCGVAHHFAEKTDEAVETVFDIILGTSNIIAFATLLVLVYANVIGMAVAAVLAGGYGLVSLSKVFGFFSAMTELREALGGGDPQGLVPQTQAELSAAYDDIVEAVFCANDAEEATANLHAVLDATVSRASYRTILKLLWNSLMMRASFAGFVNVDDRFDCDCDPLDSGDFELVNTHTFNAALTDSPTWTQNSAYSWNFSWQRTPVDENAEQPNLLVEWVFNTIDCATPAVGFDVSYTVRIQGQYDDYTGTPGSGDNVRRHGADSVCPDTDQPPSPGTETGELLERNQPVDISETSQFTVPAGTQYVSVGIDLANIHASIIDLDITLESLVITPI